ncbi:hypothetical protein G7077_10150 [Sphingomonas piscis]|uniref:PilZ domain-containing protein n=1 Tax=Sphingomonas piscis TaxID=2714943 RepID=A0A6G7YR39_9SPHN|nr:hypothetical protein G7077_10150 [Sphingomonas piscis]
MQGNSERFGRERRISVQFEALIRESDGCEFRVQVLDVSSSGFRINSHAELDVGAEVMLQLARSRPLRAQICWTRGREAGGSSSTLPRRSRKEKARAIRRTPAPLIPSSA